jgi:hypothetical protein
MLFCTSTTAKRICRLLSKMINAQRKQPSRTSKGDRHRTTDTIVYGIIKGVKKDYCNVIYHILLDIGLPATL